MIVLLIILMKLRGGTLMDFRTFDRAQEAFRLAKTSKERLDQAGMKQKVMIFVVPGRINVGPVNTELRFPFPGRIVNVYASCGVAGSTPTEIALEKCSQQSYDNNPTWTNVFSSNLVIDANEKSSNTSSLPYVLQDDVVNINDHFRINIINAGDGAQFLTVEVIVEI